MCLLCFCCVQHSVENVCLDVFLASSKWYLKTDRTILLNCIHADLPARGNFDLHLVKLMYNLILCSLVIMKTAVILIITGFHVDCCQYLFLSISIAAVLFKS